MGAIRWAFKRQASYVQSPSSAEPSATTSQSVHGTSAHTCKTTTRSRRKPRSNSAIGSGTLANYVYGVSPLPTALFAPTQYPGGQGVQGFWYDPDLKDAVTHKLHAGLSHLLAANTVLAVDYSHIIGLNGWRTI